MYYEHFRLSAAPFEFNPSASALFMSAGHREGLAALEWGLSEPSGFTMLVGEIGTGKTTLIYSLLATRHQGVRTAWVANPRLSFEDMLRQILGQLGAPQPENAGKLALLQAFDAQLASHGHDECVAVIIDEAQDLSDDALEDLRLSSNFQSLERRRLQIVLVGQLDLARRLGRPQLRQLNQRIGARALLPTLQAREIYDYVEYRLRSRGGDIETLFTRSAIRELARASGGIPRRINMLCHNALLQAYADGEQFVAAKHVRDATSDYDNLLVSKISAPAKMTASASAAMHSARARIRSASTAASASVRSAACAATTITPAMRSGVATAARAMSAAFTFAALSLLGVAVVGFCELEPVRNNLSALVQRFESQAARLRTPIVIERASAQFGSGANQSTVSAPNTIGLAPAADHNNSALDPNELTTGGPAKGPSATGRQARIKPQPETSAAPNIVPVTLPSVGKISMSPDASTKPDDAASRSDSTILVKAGDSMSKIAKRLYGSFAADQVARLTAANPQIKNANVIYPGQPIRVQQASNEMTNSGVTHE